MASSLPHLPALPLNQLQCPFSTAGTHSIVQSQAMSLPAQNRLKACLSKFKILMIWLHLHAFSPCSLLLYPYRLLMNDHAKHVLPQGLCTGCSWFLYLSAGLTYSCSLGLCLNIPSSPHSPWPHQSRRAAPS